MSTDSEILTLLKTLSLAYPERRLEEDAARLYILHLADIPSGLLEQAAHRHIAESPWFPKIADLRRTAAGSANTNDFEAIGPPIDLLAVEALALEDAFYAEDRLDPAAWDHLAAQFDRIGRPYRADHTRTKLRRLQSIIASTQDT